MKNFGAHTPPVNDRRPHGGKAWRRWIAPGTGFLFIFSNLFLINKQLSLQNLMPDDVGERQI